MTEGKSTLLVVTIIISLFLSATVLQADQTGNCTSGTEFCESLDTTNNTTTNNTNVNTNTNNNTNVNTNANTNINTSTNNNTNVNTNTNSNTNNSTNTNTNNSTSSNVNTNNNTNSNTSVNTNANTNVNTSNSTSNSTVNSTVNQNVNNNSNSTSNNTNTNSNTNVNQSTSDSNVTTDNTNTNNNNNTSDNTNRNINQSNSTQTINQNVKSEAPPASAIAPSIMSYSQDLCTVGRSGAFQGQVFGFSTGATVKDENCERLKLSKYLYDTGMKVASVSILCQDPRVFVAMEMAGTPCPYKGKIGKEATASWLENKTDRPDYKVWYKEEAAKCKRVWHSNTQLKKECVAGLK
jgi:DNA polymerase III alpha subunit (gram-positive type)